MAEVQVLEEQAVFEKDHVFFEKVRDAYPVKKVFLFGSYAKGCASKDSDIDVGVVIDLLKGVNYFDIGAQLFHEATEIDTRMEPYCILWEDYLHCGPASILAEIIRTSVEVVSVPDGA